MSEQFLGEIRMVAFAFAPKGWAVCNGQTMAIQQNAALYSLLGTTYGGNGQTTFNLPDLRNRAPAHVGQSIVLGQQAGASSVALTVNQLPQHSHLAQVSGAAANSGTPASAVPAVNVKPGYASTSNTTMASNALNAAGGSAPHDNLPPYLVVNFVIALTGVYPTRG